MTIKTSDELVSHITKIMINHEGSSILDAVLDYCEKNNAEVESVAKALKQDKILLDLIKNEAMKLKLLVKEETNQISNTIFDVLS